MLEWKQIGVHIDTAQGIVDVYVDGQIYEGAALAAPVRVLFDKGQFKLKVTVGAGAEETENGDIESGHDR